MDKFNPRDEQDRILKAYEKVLEMTPYMGKVDHIKKIYGNQYKIAQSPSTNSWYVLGKNGNDWVPVTTSFPDKDSATKFMKWLTGAGELQKQMVGTIDGSDKRINEASVEYKPIKSPKKPFSYKNKWYTRDEMKRMGLDKEASQAIKKELNIKEDTVNESVGGRLHGLFGDLIDYLDNNLYDAAGPSNEKLKGGKDRQKTLSKLRSETEKLYKTWQKELKGSGLIGW